jgi:hypothetical protein
MAIKGTSTDYSNRKIDIHVFQGVNAPKNSDITPSFGRISNFCTGVQKLIQRYTISLLTEIGSQLNYPEFGSSLIVSLTSSSNVYNRADLYALFNIANDKIQSEFLAYDATEDISDDERLRNVRIARIESTADGGVAIRLELQTFAGSELIFVVPLPI